MSVWDSGCYERTARELAPAAEVAVDALEIAGGESVLDVGCGSGNAALAAARRGASVVGVDPATRLLGVAGERARAEGLEARFAEGDAAALPFGDGEFDAVVSVFGVIFAEGPVAATESMRVVRPGGRIVVTTWTEDALTARVMDAVRQALGAPASPAVWSDREVATGLFAPHEVAVTEHRLAFTAPSVDAHVAEMVEHHPLWVAMTPHLREQGRFDEMLDIVRREFAAGNEDPRAFRTTSTYRVLRVAVPA